LEHELMRRAAAQPNVGATVMHDLVVAAVELGAQAGVAERRERVGRNGNLVVFTNGNQRGHGVLKVTRGPPRESGEEGGPDYTVGGSAFRNAAGAASASNGGIRSGDHAPSAD